MKKNYWLVFLILLTFFVISFLSNIIGPLIPEMIEDFHLSLTMAALLPFSFFIAYGLMSIPSGIWLANYGEKAVMFLAFMVSFLGSLSFALFPGYLMALTSLFLIGTGMAMLQVVINPLLRVAGGEENLAFYSIMGQLFFGLASFLSPLVYSYLAVNSSGKGERSSLKRILTFLAPENLSWITLYWMFAVISLIMVMVISFFRFPKVSLKEEEKIGAYATHIGLLKNPAVILFFLGIFFYVGSEQGVADWISKFLSVQHGYDPQTTGAKAVSWFWGLMTIGTFLGLLLVKLFDSRRVLMVFTASAIVCLSLSLFGNKTVSLIALPAIGFFASVMWPVILSLALNSIKEHHGSLSGILITGIAGGAVVPLIIGWLGDLFGLKYGMFFLYISFGYVFSIGIWAKPLVQNKLFDFMTKNSKKKVAI
ncbi:MAG TPA: sugar MFS transporter [Puia sp.]|nr:sugar MFS transporter [Puia sp.]